MSNLLTDVPPASDAEFVEDLLATPDVRIERIVSHGQASLEGFWYDQDWSEWVVVLAGSAGLLFEGESVPRTLKAGDHVHIPAHTRHRVAWTVPNEATIWLAVHHRQRRRRETFTDR